MSYLQGWESATERLDAKCGKGWKPGPGGKCVRSKGLSKGQMAGIGALGIAGAGLAYGATKGRRGKASTPMKQLPPAKTEKKTSYSAPSNLEESAKEARSTGVKEKDIIKNTKELDDFMTK